jgi:hypothetical protein
MTTVSPGAAGDVPVTSVPSAWVTQAVVLPPQPGTTWTLMVFGFTAKPLPGTPFSAIARFVNGDSMTVAVISNGIWAVINVIMQAAVALPSLHWFV